MCLFQTWQHATHMSSQANSIFFPLVLGCFPWTSHQHAEKTSSVWLMKGDCGRSNSGILNSYITTANTVAVMLCHCELHCVSIHYPVAHVQTTSKKDVKILCVLHSFSVAWRESETSEDQQLHRVFGWRHTDQGLPPGLPTGLVVLQRFFCFFFT